MTMCSTSCAAHEQFVLAIERRRLTAVAGVIDRLIEHPDLREPGDGEPHHLAGGDQRLVVGQRHRSGRRERTGDSSSQPLSPLARNSRAGESAAHRRDRPRVEIATNYDDAPKAPLVKFSGSGRGASRPCVPRGCRPLRLRQYVAWDNHQTVASTRIAMCVTTPSRSKRNASTSWRSI
jgi:hypothetical protein